MKKFIDFAFNYWRWFVGAGALLTAVCIFFIFNITIDNSLETLSIDNDPMLLTLHEIEKKYGSDEFVVISFKGTDIFTPRTLKMIDRITRRIEKVDNVEKVLSLTNASIITGESDSFGIIPLVPGIFLQSNGAEELKKKVIINKMYKRMLFSDDGEATSIIAWMASLGKDDAKRWKIVNTIKKIIDKEKDSRKFYYYGFPVIQKVIFDVTVKDQFILSGLLSLLVGMLLYFFFRDIKIVILPFLLIGVTGIWALGLLVMSGSTLNFLTLIIPIIVLIVCMCDSVHIMTQHQETKGNYTNNQDAIKDVVGHIGIPLMLTSITTAVGFFSLGTSGLKSVRDFGIFTGLGTLFAFVASITLLPMVMSILKLNKENPGKEKNFAAMEKILIEIGGVVYRRKWFVLVLSVIIILVSIIGMFKIESRQDVISMLKDRTELEDAFKFIDFTLGGSCEFAILLEGKEDNTIIEPENLKIIERIQYRLLNERVVYGEMDVPLARKVISIVDYLKDMNQAVNNNNSDYYTIPSTKEDAIDFLEMYSFEGDQTNIHSFISSDYQETRIKFFTLTAVDFVQARKAFDTMVKIMSEEVQGTGLNAKCTGRGFLTGNMIDSLVLGMVESFSVALVIILIMMIIVFRSIKMGLLSMIINVTPAVITFGVMGWFDIPLNIATCMVPSVAIGIAVDDTVHFMWRLRKEIDIDGDYKHAICRTLRSVGKPIVTTSILLCTGFSVFYFSGLTILTQFGVLTLITVFGALMADLFLAPALMVIFKPIKINQELEKNLFN